MASGPITSWEIDGETVETMIVFFLGRGAPKSLQMVSAAIKLVMKNLDSVLKSTDIILQTKVC